MQNRPKIGIPVGKEIYFYKPSEILYCLEEGGFAHLILQHDQRLILQRNLETVTQILPDYFLCIHPSYLINAHHLTKYIENGGGEVVMSDGATLPVNKDRKETLLQYFQLI